MGVFYETIPASLEKWILEQHMFCVATAPLHCSGHINVSPKGGQYFGLVDEKTFWYLDLTGSGSETIAHLHEPNNGRICIMFNAFEGPPKIVRLWGRGEVLEWASNEFDDFVKTHDVNCIPGTRSIIVVHVHQVGSSCGWSVPYMDFKDYRPILNDHMVKKRDKFEAGDENESMDRYWAYKSSWSMDGLPGMKRGLAVGQRDSVAPLKKMVGPLAPKLGIKSKVPTYTFEQMVMVFMTALILGFVAAGLGSDVLKDKASFLQDHFRDTIRLPQSLR